jgi:GNAT superfamily N-acetyltransferase
MRLTEAGYFELPPGRLAAVVTYLEMRQPPDSSGGGASGSTGFSVHRAEHAGLDWYRRLFRAIGEDWLWFSRLRMSDAELAAILHDPAVDLLVLDGDRGLIELDRRRFPEIEIVFCGVAAGMIGKGAGRVLIEQAIEVAFSYRPERLWLHTCTLDHPRALDFYRKAGFVPYRRGIEIMDDPRITGDLPKSAAPGIPLL